MRTSPLSISCSFLLMISVLFAFTNSVTSKQTFEKTQASSATSTSNSNSLRYVSQHSKKQSLYKIRDDLKGKSIYKTATRTTNINRSKRYITEAGNSSNNDDCRTVQKHSPAIYGVRCDDSGSEEGILIVKANEATAVMLIGKDLDSNISIALTSEQAPAQSDCTHADRVRSIQFKNVSSNVAQISIDVPPPGNKQPYYICLRDSQGRWFHQGTESWLKIHVKEDLLPLYMKIIVVACLLMLSGLFSGLNLGLMALDKNELQVIISCGSDTEKRYARAIEPVRRRGNYLLCSILFSNVLVNSTIAVLLEELTSGIVAVMTSTIFIVMFGEILPQAFCSRHGLAVGAKTVSITYFCMIVTFPLSYPVSSCLDWALGEEIGHAYDRERLMEFIRVTRDYNNLETDEVNIISGALKLKRIPLSEVMTCIEDVYMLDLNSCLDFNTIQGIIERGYSRIPVHEPGNKKNIVALLFAKDLALLDPDDRTPVKTLISFYNHPIMYLFEDTTLDLALNEFKTGKSHMAIVRRVLDDGDRDPVYEITGIVTLEDVIEEIMQMEINDETDTLTDNRRKRRRKEAQVRGDFAQFTHFGVGESSQNVATPQLCLAAYQYLATTVEPFSIKFISDSILKRLMSQKIYFKLKVDDNNKQKRRLYTAGEAADYFVMVLEGRVQVACGRENLVFEGGPFSFFGQAALSTGGNSSSLTQTTTAGTGLSVDSSMIATATGIESSTRRESIQQHLDRRESLIVERKMNGQLSMSMKRLEQNLLADNQQPQVTNHRHDSSAGVQQTTPSSRGLRSSDSRLSIVTLEGKQSGGGSSGHYFVPDYTVEIVSDTSYMKVTRNEYLAALKATLVERGGGGNAIITTTNNNNNNNNTTTPTNNASLFTVDDEDCSTSTSEQSDSTPSSPTTTATKSVVASGGATTRPMPRPTTIGSAVANNIELFSGKYKQQQQHR